MSSKYRQTALATLIATAALLPLAAKADRCSVKANGTWACQVQQRTHSFKGNFYGRCILSEKSRNIAWQVPEGTPPAGGWPVAFFFHGTSSKSEPLTADSPPVTTMTSRPAAMDTLGTRFLLQAMHELLDDPRGTGKKYAVFLPQAAPKAFFDAWQSTTNPYTSSDDYCFLSDFYKAIAGSDRYGDGGQFNMAKKHGFGFSSGGYNTSRMAVSMNRDSSWKAMGIIAASYATCSGGACKVAASVPANHPPTKFYHGTADKIVPITTMRPYFHLLQQSGIPTEKIESAAGHQITADVIGNTGSTTWFDQY